MHESIHCQLSLIDSNSIDFVFDEETFQLAEPFVVETVNDVHFSIYSAVDFDNFHRFFYNMCHACRRQVMISHKVVYIDEDILELIDLPLNSIPLAGFDLYRYRHNYDRSHRKLYYVLEQISDHWMGLSLNEIEHRIPKLIKIHYFTAECACIHLLIALHILYKRLSIYIIIDDRFSSNQFSADVCKLVIQ